MPTYAMALNGTLGRKNAKAKRTISSHLTTAAEGLEGIAKSEFEAVAREAESRCPVSNAYRGTVQVTLEARAT